MWECVRAVLWLLFSSHVHSKPLSTFLLSSYGTFWSVRQWLTQQKSDFRQMEALRACTTVIPQFNSIFFKNRVQSVFSSAAMPDAPVCSLCLRSSSQLYCGHNLRSSLETPLKPHYCEFFLEHFPVLCSHSPDCMRTHRQHTFQSLQRKKNSDLLLKWKDQRWTKSQAFLSLPNYRC